MDGMSRWDGVWTVLSGLSWWDWLWLALSTLGVLVLVGIPMLRGWHGQDPFEGRR